MSWVCRNEGTKEGKCGLWWGWVLKRRGRKKKKGRKRKVESKMRMIPMRVAAIKRKKEKRVGSEDCGKDGGAGKTKLGFKLAFEFPK